MSLRTIFDRVVDLELTSSSGKDVRGNEIRSSTTLADVPCFRWQVKAEEDTADRDQQARTFVYLFPVEHVVDDEVHDLGELMTGRDRIHDGDEILEVLGTPVVPTSRGRRRHVEARAYYEEG